MLLDEHHSKLLFAEAGIPVPEGVLIRPGDINAPDWPLPWYLKVQVLTGGRGKAGGILRVDEASDLPRIAEILLDKDIKGHKPPFLRLEQGVAAARECYLSLAVSRDLASLVLTAGRVGGVDIEDSGRDNILVQTIPSGRGLDSFHVRAAFFHLEATQEQWPAFKALVERLYAAVRTHGLLLAEINPLVVTSQGEWLALDGKVEIDDNHLALHPELDRFYAPEHASHEERVARQAGLAFHSLSGRVGLMANGAGLAMATMDLLNDSGLPAANFMDLGGAADLDRMRTALTLLFGDTAVEAVFINIFGGVLSCEKVALALAEALDGQAPDKPLVVRLSGNQAAEGRAILEGLGQGRMRIVSEIGQALDALREFDGQTPAPAGTIGPAVASAASIEPAPFPVGLPFDQGAPVLVQGITGRVAQLHTRLMLEYGTNVVAGVTPFKGGQSVLGVPVYNSVAEAVREHEVAASIIFVPAAFASDAIMEAAQNRIPWAVCITDGLTQQDMLSVRAELAATGTRLVGPNNPGLIAPGRTKIGIMPGHAFTPGPVAVLSRSGTLTYEVAARLSAVGLGQSLCVGIGGDPFVGTSFIDLCGLLREHDGTRAVVVLGEIGGRAEEDLAAWVTDTGFHKPVVGFIAGRTAPPGKRLGHAGAILEGAGGIESKLDAMRAAGFVVCRDLSALTGLVADKL